MKLTGKTTAEAISAIFNAPIVAIYAFTVVVLLRQTSSTPSILVTSWLFSGVLPILIILLMKRRGIIKDMYASERGTRLKPFLGASACYLAGALILVLLGATREVTALMGCYLFNTIVMMVITLRWKISIHASGISGPFTFLAYVFGALWAPALLLILPVGWARIRLEAHTFNQVVVGFLLTIPLTWLQLLVYLR